MTSPLRRIAAWAYTRFPALVERWVASHPLDEPTGGAFVEGPHDPAALRLGLVTTGGVYPAGETPFDLVEPDGDPSWRVLPAASRAADMAIAHSGYDTRDARRDPNVVAPLDRLRELVQAGRLAGLVDGHVGLMGHLARAPLAAFERRSLPLVVDHLEQCGAQAVLLAPA